MAEETRGKLLGPESGEEATTAGPASDPVLYAEEDGDGILLSKNEPGPLAPLMAAPFNSPKSGCLSMIAGSGSLKEVESCCSFSMLFLYSEFSWMRSSSVDEGM